MEYTLLDFITLVILMSSTVLIISVRKVFLIDEEKTFQSLVSGFSILTFVSLVKLLSFNQYLHNIPFINEPMFFDFVYWIGMITGFTIVLHSTSRWLPIYREYKKIAYTRINELEIFRKAEQIIQIDKKIPTIFNSVLKLFVTTYPIHCGGSYLKDAKTGTMILSSFYCDKDEHVFDVNEVTQLISEFTFNFEHRDIIVNRKISQSTVSIFPVVQAKKLVGLFVLNTESDLKQDIIESIKLVIDILQSKITFIESLETSQSNRFHSHWVDKLLSVTHTNKSIKENISTIFTLLKEKVNLDHFTVCVLKEGRMKKVMIGENGQLLEYIYESCFESSSLEKYALTYNQSIKINDLVKETNFFIDPMLMKMDCRSLYALPVIANDTECLIILSSLKVNCFDRLDTSQLEPVLLLVEKILSSDLEKRKANQTAKMKEMLISFASHSVSASTIEDLDRALLDLVKRNIDSEFIRISLFEQDKRFLQSQALSCSVPHRTMTPENGLMLIDLMPGHIEAARKQKIVTLSSDSDLTIEEQNQIYGRSFGSLIISPIVTHNQIDGFMDIGYKDENKKPDAVQTKFLYDATLIYGYARKNLYIRDKLEQQNKLLRLKNNDLVTNKTMNRLKSSVTSVLGSMELLQGVDSSD
ncbi:MAG: hypothetical protein DWP97_14535, partial [Calditrichaeota bacterium]